MQGFKKYIAWFLILTLTIFLGFYTFFVIHTTAARRKAERANVFNRGSLATVSAFQFQKLSINTTPVFLPLADNSSESPPQGGPEGETGEPYPLDEPEDAPPAEILDKPDTPPDTAEPETESQIEDDEPEFNETEQELLPDDGNSGIFLSSDTTDILTEIRDTLQTILHLFMLCIASTIVWLIIKPFYNLLR